LSLRYWSERLRLRSRGRFFPIWHP
jgi:hypothetical protein